MAIDNITTSIRICLLYFRKWYKEIGAHERGHLVVFLDKKKNAGGEWEITYWSSNKPVGYGMKTTKAHFMRWCLFSRITEPKNLQNLRSLPEKDPFLANMLTKDFTRDDVRKKCRTTGKVFNQANLQLFLAP